MKKTVLIIIVLAFFLGTTPFIDLSLAWSSSMEGSTVSTDYRVMVEKDAKKAKAAKSFKREIHKSIVALKESMANLILNFKYSTSEEVHTGSSATLANVYGAGSGLNNNRYLVDFGYFGDGLNRSPFSAAPLTQRGVYIFENISPVGNPINPGTPINPEPPAPPAPPDPPDPEPPAPPDPPDPPDPEPPKPDDGGMVSSVEGKK